MYFMLGFVVGIVIGGTAGILFMALLQAGRED